MLIGILAILSGYHSSKQLPVIEVLVHFGINIILNRALSEHISEFFKNANSFFKFTMQFEDKLKRKKKLYRNASISLYECHGVATV